MTISVTFVPGAAGQGSFWSPVAERLPAAWRSQLLDLPGLGPIPARSDVAGYDDLVDFAAATIAAPAAVVAQSMGGYVALQLALRYPERVTHLVLAVLSGGVDMAVHRAADWRESYAAAHPAAEGWARDEVPDLTTQLDRISVPVLLLWATRDPLSPLSIAETIRSRIHGASLVTFDTDDHWIARSRPDATTAAIVRFIAPDQE